MGCLGLRRMNGLRKKETKEENGTRELSWLLCVDGNVDVDVGCGTV